MISWTVLNFLASSIATFPKASFILSKFHSKTFTPFLKVFFIFFPLSAFQGDKAILHQTERAISVIAAFHLLQVLSGWGFQLPLTLCSSFPFFFCLLSKPFCSCSFLAKIFPHFSHVLFFFPSFSDAFHDAAFFLHELMPLPLCQWIVPSCLQILVATSPA